MTMTQQQRQWNAMVRYARPLVQAGEDYQAVQHALLNEFDWLTNSDDDEELTMDVVRECEAQLYAAMKDDELAE